MKSLIISLVLIGTSAFATSIDRTPVVAMTQGYYAGLTSVALLADRRLQVVNQKGVVKTTIVSESVFKKMEREVKDLAQAEIMTIKNEYICLTFAPVIPTTLTDLSVTKYNFESRSFEGYPRQILSERGCYVRLETFPVGDYYQYQAYSVRSELVILGLSTLN